MPGAITICIPSTDDDTVRSVEHAAATIDARVVHKLADAPAEIPIVLIAGSEAIADQRVAYRTRPGLDREALQALLVSTATGCTAPAASARSTPADLDDARRASRVFLASRKLAAATDLAMTEALAIQTVVELLDVPRAYCLYCDSDTGAIWSEQNLRSREDERKTTTGMVGWAARTGLACAAVNASADPRYDANNDNPDGNRSDRILVQPVVGTDTRVHAILVAIRSTSEPALGPSEAALLAGLGKLMSPLLDQLSRHMEAQKIVSDAASDQTFRSEALEAAELPRSGDVIRVSPGWLPWAYRAFIGLILASIALVAFGRISTYSAGPALIRTSARRPVTSSMSGYISEVRVSPGERVKAGELLAQFDDRVQRLTLARLRRELESYPRDASGTASESVLRLLRSQLEEAQTALDRCQIRSTTAGVVRSVRVSPGTHVESGEVVASVLDDTAKLEVVALLPGKDLPWLAPGMHLQLELVGYEHAYHEVNVEDVASDVVSPAEARRILGMSAELLDISGPVVLVRGSFVQDKPVVDGRPFAYRDGMFGTASTRIGSERILFALVPGMRGLGK